MGRRRVMVLAPAIARMQCMSNPYKRVDDEDGKLTKWRKSFLSGWRKKRMALKFGRRSKSTETRLRWGFRVSKLKIKRLSPLHLLKKLRDAYVNMMLSLESNMEGSTAASMGPHYMDPYRGAGMSMPWVFPAFAMPLVY
nr:hypothetical protein PHYPA_014595 [Physcomitrium patens]